MMRLPTQFALLGATWVFGVGCDSSRVNAPPVNTAISNTAGSVTLPFTVQCDGPADEVALLGGICGSGTSGLEWFLTDAPSGMATMIGPGSGPFFLLYDRVDHDPSVSANVAGQAHYAAFVFLQQEPSEASPETILDGWIGAEAVSSGAVVTQQVDFLACGGGWLGQGSFVWRTTKLTFAWSASELC
jgi:hypothetical protein